MEALGGAASVFAVVSVADQLANRIKQLYSFWSAISEAPGNIRALAAGLQPLLGILTQISNDGQKYGEETNTTDILKQCLSHVTALISITETLEKGFESSSKRQRKWNAIKAVFDEDKIASFKAELAELKSTLILAQGRMLSRSSNAHFEEQKLSASVLQKSLAKLSASDSAKLAQISKTDRDDCIRAFYLSDITSRLDSVPKREPGTCEWVTRHRKYQAWLNSPSSELLWLSGNPGCGKTVISSFVVEALRTQPEISTIYFMCDDKFEGFRSKEDILRSVLHQLLTQDASLIRHAIDHFGRMKASVAKSSATMWTIFVDIWNDRSRAKPVYFVLDALDECEDQSREWFLEKLGQLFCLDEGDQTNVQRGPAFKMLITSRPWEDIEYGLRRLTRIQLKTEIEGGIQEDIDVFIDIQVRALAKRCRHTLAQQELITNALRSKANGMFLWVALIVKDLFKTPAKSIEQRLQHLPKTLFQVYDDILSKVDESSVERVKLILMWVTTAYRPLSLEELALACEPDLNCANPSNLECLVDELKRDIDLCGPILMVRYRFVHLIHQSAKDYLFSKIAPVGEESGSSHFHVDRTTSHARSLQLCLHYLALKDFAFHTLPYQHEFDGPIPKRSSEAMDAHWDNSPFLSYSAQYWRAHYDDCDDESCVDLVLVFFLQHRQLAAWLGLYALEKHEDNDYDPKQFDEHDIYAGSTLHVAVLLGMVSVFSRLLSLSGIDIQAADNRSCSVLKRSISWPKGLDLVSENKRLDIFQKLLARRVNIEPDLLHLAAKSGQHLLVDALLNAGAAVDARDQYGRTALHEAAGRLDLRGYMVAKILLQHGAMVDVVDNRMHIPLHILIYEAREPIGEDIDEDAVYEMITALLDAGADINKQWYYGKDDPERSLLESLVNNPWGNTGRVNDRMLEHLLINGPKVSLRPGDPDETPYLYRAVKTKSYRLIPLLLKAGADIYKSKSGIEEFRPFRPFSCGSVLEIAIADGEEDIVKAFLAHRQVSNLVQTQALQSAQLHKAVLLGNNVLVTELLAKGTICRFSQSDSSGMSILMQAVQGGSLSVVQTISTQIRRSIQKFASDTNAVKALWLAALRGHTEIVRLLLDLGVPLNGTLLPPEDAMVQSHLISCQESHYPETHYPDEHWNPLLAAAYSGQDSIAEFLVIRGADKEACKKCTMVTPDQKIRYTAIRIAGLCGHTNLVKLLLKHKADVEPSLPQQVCDVGHYSIAILLLKNPGLDIEGRYFDGDRTLLSYLAGKPALATVQTLLEQGANVQTRDRYGENCLKRALAYDNLEMASMLIQHGVDIEGKGSSVSGSTSLLLAANLGRTDMLELLLKNGANPNAIDPNGTTALHIAVCTSNETMVERLLHYGADFKQGKIPLLVAPRHKMKLIAIMLQEWEEEQAVK